MLQVFAKWMVGIILVTNCWTVFDKNDELTVMEDVTIYWGSISLLFLFFSICGLSMGIHYRRCISCRKVAPKDFFWRVVRLYPLNRVQLDCGMGRSAYLCPQKSCLLSAQRKNRLGRSLKADVPSEIFYQLEQRLLPLEATTIQF